MAKEREVVNMAIHALQHQAEALDATGRVEL
jgi:hypothetical protein